MKFPWRGALGLALTVFFLWLAFRHTQWTDLARDIRSANVPLALLAVVVVTMIFPLRARRWRPILDPIAPNLPFGPLWRATAIGMMANNLLPARMGELVRAYALSREKTTPPVSFSAAFASLVVDRVFDGVIVILLMVGAMFASDFPSTTLIGNRPASDYAMSGVLALVVVTGGLYAIVYFPDKMLRLFELFARRIAPRFEER